MVDAGFFGLGLVLLVAMLLLDGYETIPYHLMFVGFAAVYGFRAWDLRATVGVLAAMILATGLVMVVRWSQGTMPTDELSEIVLMPTILAAMVWHARRAMRAERELLRLASFERECRLREREFARDTAHALRTPLTIARGHLEMLAESLPDDESRADVGIVLCEVERMTRMASRLLAIAELERPDVLVRARVDVAALVRSTYARWMSSVPRAWLLECAPSAWVDGDSDVLQAALDAVVENSVRVTREGGVIQLSCRVVGERVHIDVADDGPGIAEGDLERVFQRFWRGTERRGGTGLGLSFTRAAATAHGGSAWAEAPRAGGVLVHLLLPVAQGSGAAVTPLAVVLPHQRAQATAPVAREAGPWTDAGRRDDGRMRA